MTPQPRLVRRSLHISCVVLALHPTLALAESLEQLVDRAAIPGAVRTAVGVTLEGAAIPAVLTPPSLSYESPGLNVLLVGGLDGSPDSVEAVLRAWETFHGGGLAADLAQGVALSIVPAANPEGWLSGSRRNSAGADLTSGYPPPGEAYQSQTAPESQYLWRWIGMHAPDLAVVVLTGENPGWRIPADAGAALTRLGGALGAGPAAPGSLAAQLSRGSPSATGAVPAIEVAIVPGSAADILGPLLEAIRSTGGLPPSPARSEIRKRLERGPLDVARQLAKVYGHAFPQTVYIPATALIGRLRLAEIEGDGSVLEDVERLASPFAGGGRSSLENPTSSHLPGHLIFGELARATGKRDYVRLVRAAADLGFDEGGAMKESMPFHNEMSDSVYMGCAILAQAGALTGDRRYFDMAVRHLEFMQTLDLRPDGLYRHSPLDETAWGRGNGFPALGLALALTDIPEEFPGRSAMLESFRTHIAALLPHQDATGAWHQVIDRTGSYRELTATSMISFAIARGLRMGWLSGDEFERAAQRGWYAIRARTAPDGSLVDVCEGTGKQPGLRAYYNRKAILGPDDRGGAMALLAATEFALLRR